MNDERIYCSVLVGGPVEVWASEFKRLAEEYPGYIMEHVRVVENPETISNKVVFTLLKQ